MKSPCIRHPRERFVIVRPWQLEFCQGNKCAAMLLGVLEFWHNQKLDNVEQSRKANKAAQAAGEKPTHSVSLLQWHKEQDLVDMLYGMFEVKTVRKAINQLVELGAVTVTSNPNHRFSFDRTRFFQFQPVRLQVFIEEYSARCELGLADKSSTDAEKGARSSEKGGTSTIDNAHRSHASAGVPSGGPDERFPDQDTEAPLDDGSLAGYERRRSQAHQKHYFQQHFTEAQRLLSNGQLLERQPLTDEESASLSMDLYEYRCSVHGLDQEEPKEEAYFSDADQYQFKKLSEEEATARFSILNAVIAYLRLDTKALQPTLPPEQVDAHQRLRMVVWNGKQLRDNWTLALVAIRAFLAELPPLETQTTKG